MNAGHLEIVPCPPALVADAFALALSELAPEQRREIVAPLIEKSVSGRIEGLQVALEGRELRAAAWGQRHPGNTAVLWASHLAGATNTEAARMLVESVVRSLDAADVRMCQVLLPDRVGAIVPVIEAAGFQFLAELWYLNWDVPATFAGDADDSPLQFEPYSESRRSRLTQLIERTYVGTQDCPAMNGRRSMDEVLEGYRSTGRFRPANWWFVRAEGQDVGVLLLAEHAPGEHWELMYMGLVPEVRGRGWGRAIVRYAQQLASSAAIERVVLAVDAKNLPAMKMYRDAGFMAWDRRTVYVRFAAISSSASA